jgi:type I restriction enzyme M protein
MTKPINQDEINMIIWKACDTFRGAVDPSEYKNYILTMLFVKYLSDMWKERRSYYEELYKGNQQRIERALAKERFIVPPDSDFDFLYAKREAPNVGELINIALENIERANITKLEGVFRNVDFNSESALGETRERNRRLKSLLEDFKNEKLELGDDRPKNNDIIGDVYEYLIGRFAAGAGKKAGEFYTPQEVSTLLARLVRPKPGDRICDPACGSGSLLIKVAKEIKEPGGAQSENFQLNGQESNGSTWALCRMNMFLHGMDAARIEWCDTISTPKLIADDKLMRFDVVVANPPFSLDKWGAEDAAHDRFNRFWRAIPPKSKGDYAFITHMVEIAVESTGKVGVIVPHGVLFRGGSEGSIRKKLIEENILEAVIGLPKNLFFGTDIQAAILLFNKGKKTNDVLFIDASRDYQEEKKQNRLREKDIDRIGKAFRVFKTETGYAYRATLEEISQNDFNLNIPRYVKVSDDEPEVDVKALQLEIDALESQLFDIRNEMAGYLKELGYGR